MLIFLKKKKDNHYKQILMKILLSNIKQKSYKIKF